MEVLVQAIRSTFKTEKLRSARTAKLAQLSGSYGPLPLDAEALQKGLRLRSSARKVVAIDRSVDKPRADKSTSKSFDGCCPLHTANKELVNSSVAYANTTTECGMA